MGRLEQFAQLAFAEETERITSGAAGWQDPPEVRLEKVQSDGFLVIRRPQSLAELAAPWPVAQPHAEVMIELKMAGNHLDRKAIERALLRRQARQVQRVEELDSSWRGEEPLWLVAPHLPDWLDDMRRPTCVAPGCYWIEPQWQRFLWIAANELPLTDELIPFLLSRSGQALDDFSWWVAQRRPADWVHAMLEFLPMSISMRDKLTAKYGGVDEPEVQARRKQILEVVLKTNPWVQQLCAERRIEGRVEGRIEGRIEGQIEGRLSEARAALRRVLARRQLTLSKDDDARIEACTDLTALERWLDQAVTARSSAEALG